MTHLIASATFGLLAGGVNRPQWLEKNVARRRLQRRGRVGISPSFPLILWPSGPRITYSLEDGSITENFSWNRRLRSLEHDLRRNSQQDRMTVNPKRETVFSSRNPVLQRNKYRQDSCEGGQILIAKRSPLSDAITLEKFVFFCHNPALLNDKSTL